VDGALRFNFTRRGLLSEASTWLKVAAETTPERPARRLVDLGAMADPELAAIRPRIVPGCTISVERGRVLARPAGTVDPIPLMATAGPSLTVFNAVNGMTTVAQMAARVAAETGWDDAEAFAFCRKTILHLVGLRVCIPADKD
jgi:hypothetical protein